MQLKNKLSRKTKAKITQCEKFQPPEFSILKSKYIENASITKHSDDFYQAMIKRSKTSQWRSSSHPTKAKKETQCSEFQFQELLITKTKYIGNLSVTKQSNDGKQVTLTRRLKFEHQAKAFL